MYAILKFDTEDVFFPPEYRIDDIPGWLAEIMTRHGVTGTFCIFGQKARTLKDRGRDDVIEQLVRHDLVSHQQGNIHPFIPEILQGKGWLDGMDAMRRYEDAVCEDFSYAFGKSPVALSRHNTYYGVQHVALAGERGMPYLSSIIGVEGYEQPVWYAGTLTTVSRAFMEFDEIYSCDYAFEKRFRELDRFIADRLERGVEFVTIFGCHPVRVMARGWFEHYAVAAGSTRTPQELGWLYGVKSREEEERAKTNFSRLVKYLADHSDIEMLGIEEAARLFSTQPVEISRDELTAYSEQLEHAKKPLLHMTFSPAELLCGLAESIVYAAEHGDIPPTVKRQNVLGPRSRPIAGQELDTINQGELAALCRQALNYVDENNCLPANVNTDAGRVGVGQLAVLAAHGYLALAHSEKYDKLSVPQATRYPDEALEVDSWIRRYVGEHWAFDTDFTCDSLAEQARLQTWTLKPAWLRPPRGPAYSGGRIYL